MRKNFDPLSSLWKLSSTLCLFGGDVEEVFDASYGAVNCDKFVRSREQSSIWELPLEQSALLTVAMLQYENPCQLLTQQRIQWHCSSSMDFAWQARFNFPRYFSLFAPVRVRKHERFWLGWEISRNFCNFRRPVLFRQRRFRYPAIRTEIAMESANRIKNFTLHAVNIADICPSARRGLSFAWRISKY